MMRPRSGATRSMAVLASCISGMVSGFTLVPCAAHSAATGQGGKHAEGGGVRGSRGKVRGVAGSTHGVRRNRGTRQRAADIDRHGEIGEVDLLRIAVEVEMQGLVAQIDVAGADDGDA